MAGLSFIPGASMAAGFAAAVWWAGFPFALPFLEQPYQRPQRVTGYMREVLGRLAANTNLFFETSITEDDNALPPDNVQIEPNKGISHRTSPTNIGLYLMSLLSAERLRILSTDDAVERIHAAVSSLEVMPKWEGHLYNWYDTRTLAPMRPLFVSSVDSGNLAVCLLACAQGIRVLMPGLPVKYHDLAARLDAGLEAGQKPQELDFTGFERYREACVQLLEMRRKYLGQMDLNLKSERVWAYYDSVLGKLAEYGAAIVRLDAFAYAPKTPGLRNFMNEPDTWDTLERIRQMADSHGLTLLPEIHDPYAAGTYEKVARKGYMTYDFFLPGLVIDAIENHDGTRLMRWAEELREKNIRTVNMLGCHDGIPMLDLKGLLSDTEIEKLIALIVSRGGMIKNLHGAKNVYYQVNCTYFSALGADERKMLLARAIQLFMPGKPQVWYLDLFAGKNDLEAVRRGGEAAHKEINRTNLTRDAVADALKKDVVRDQLALLRMRNTCPAFDFDADMTVRQPQNDQLEIIWEKDGSRASLRANLTTYEFAAQTDCGAARTILTSR